MDIKLQVSDQQPVIRINTFKKQKHLDVEFNPSEFEFYTLDGEKVFEKEHPQTKWRVKVKQAKPFNYEYFLILREADKRETLESEIGKFKSVMLHHVGGKIFIEDEKVTQNDKYLLSAGPFASEREARHHSQDYAQVNHCRIYRQPANESRGVLEIFDPHYEIFAEVKNGLRLIPKNGDAFFKINRYAMSIHNGEKVEHQDLMFQGALFITLDQDQTLMGINEIGIENYLKGVLNSELGNQVSLEFAKSMAILARSQVFSRIGQVHPREGFDFCNEGNCCLSYFGRLYNNSNIDKALEETRGMILSKNERVCSAFFSYSCGGHTENPADIWFHTTSKMKTGKYDTDIQVDCQYDLRKEEDIQKWILAGPAVLCKPDGQEVQTIAQQHGEAFRWEVFYTRQELEEIIFEKTGEELGIIYEIIPISRGVSGRIKELEILGSLKNIHIKGELNIRSALSDKFLNSSCFIIEPELDMAGVPINFTFIGAGMGHGVGLCKVGAAKMAAENKDYMQILRHYFDTCEVKRIY